MEVTRRVANQPYGWITSVDGLLTDTLVNEGMKTDAAELAPSRRVSHDQRVVRLRDDAQSVAPTGKD